MADAFDEYVSLGDNCEGAFQLRRVLGCDSASFFSWNVTSPQALRSLLEHRFAGVMQMDNIATHGEGFMLHDTAHGYLFHNPFDRPDFQNDPAFATKWAAQRGKTDHLVTKFLAPRPDGHRTAYFYKVQDPADVIYPPGHAAYPPNNPGAIRMWAVDIGDRLAGLHANSSFELIVLQHKQYTEPAWDHARVHNRYLPRTAPWLDAHDAHVFTWDRVLAEFPHRQPMRLAGY